MRYLTFSPQEAASYPVCFLVPTLHEADMRRHYVTPHLGGQEDELLAYDLFKGPKKTPVALQREYLAELVPNLTHLGVEYLVVCDADYFKTITKQSSAENMLGYVVDSGPDYPGFKVVYCPNFKGAFYNPEKVQNDIAKALDALNQHRADAYRDPGVDIIHFEAYPDTVEDIEAWLDKLIEMDCDLASDIEGFSLKHHTAGVGTISFAWNEHEGIAFAVDFLSDQSDALQVRDALRRFFIRFHASGRIMRWHHIAYDVYVLIYQLFMKDLLDTEGLLNGMDVLLTNWDCTKLITYLATNSTAGNKLGLKAQAQEFAGNYAVGEIENIRNIPLPDLLRYNLIDTMSTWYVYKKHWPTLLADDQLEIYETIFKPATLDIIQMQLTGLPLNRDRVIEVQGVFQAIADEARAAMLASPLVQEFVHVETDLAWERDYTERRDKAKNPDKIKRKDRATFPDKEFNPNSAPQLQRLLYEQLELPVLDLTDSKLPATGGDTLEKLINHTTIQREKDLIRALIDFKAVDKILTAFIPAFLEAPRAPDGWHCLFGFFNLGGTVSGRLSSSDPNLQNLPANVDMILSPALYERYKDILHPFMKKGKLSIGKLIKSCFSAPPGWLFVGLDFASLEDRISALTTKDPNKLKVYMGHLVYEVVINGEVHHIRDDTMVSYRGKSYTGEQFYDLCQTDSSLRAQVLDPP